MTYDIRPLTLDNVPDFTRSVLVWRADWKRWLLVNPILKHDITPYIGNPALAYTHWCYVTLPPKPEENGENTST
jgi:hypothetical protein